MITMAVGTHALSVRTASQLLVWKGLTYFIVFNQCHVCFLISVMYVFLPNVLTMDTEQPLISGVS